MELNLQVVRTIKHAQRSTAVHRPFTRFDVPVVTDGLRYLAIKPPINGPVMRVPGSTHNLHIFFSITSIVMPEAEQNEMIPSRIVQAFKVFDINPMTFDQSPVDIQKARSAAALVKAGYPWMVGMDSASHR